MAVCYEKGEKGDSKVHARPIHSVDKNPALPRPSKHRQAVLILRRHFTLLHNNVVHGGRLFIYPIKKTENPHSRINFDKAAIGLLRFTIHARALHLAQGHQALKYCPVSCTF